MTSVLPGLQIDNVSVAFCRYWSLAEAHPSLWQPNPDALLSDCRFREDLVALRAGDIKQSQILKEQMEVQQRHDAKLRKS